jgi:hypothetical protein
MGVDNTIPAIPQSITPNNSGVLMSNGATVHAANLNSLPPVTNSVAVNNAAANASQQAMNLAAAPSANSVDVSTAHNTAAVAANHAAIVAKNSGNHASASHHAALAQKHLWLAQEALKQNEYFFHSPQMPQWGKREGFETPTTSTSCNIAPPRPTTMYCKSAPFSSSNGEPYFRVSDAYGVPTQG